DQHRAAATEAVLDDRRRSVAEATDDRGSLWPQLIKCPRTTNARFAEIYLDRVGGVAVDDLGTEDVAESLGRNARGEPPVLYVGAGACLGNQQSTAPDELFKHSSRISRQVARHWPVE